MDRFIAKYRDQVNGVISGFDRLVFHGNLRTIGSAHDREKYLAFNRILKKDFGQQGHDVSQRLQQASLAEAVRTGRPVIYLTAGQLSKEDLARSMAARCDGSENRS